MSTLFRNKKDGWWKLRDLIAEGKGFHNSTGSFRGGDIFSGKGRLPEEWWTGSIGTLRDSITDYVIYSYGTPIAWHICKTADGLTVDCWVQPDESYSVTTTGHQNLVQVALSRL